MLEKLEKMISNDEEIFWTGEVSEDRIDSIEKELNVKFLEEYKVFLKKYGMMIGYGVEILGCGKSTVASVVKETKRHRKFGLPNNFIIISSADEWVYCLDLIDGEVFSWDIHNKQPEKVAENFEEYICKEIVQAREEWEE